MNNEMNVFTHLDKNFSSIFFVIFDAQVNVPDIMTSKLFTTAKSGHWVSRKDIMEVIYFLIKHNIIVVTCYVDPFHSNWITEEN